MKTMTSEPCRTEILQRLRALRPESTPRWGRMSAHQMVCHLADTFRMALGEKPVSEVGSPLRQRFIKFIALYTPLPWPPDLQTRPEVDQLCGGTGPVDFAQDLREVERLAMVMLSRPRGAAWARHPIFGRMSRRAWLRWAYLHTDHHLRQFGG